jgi:photosystem II stability/assembly factor-like uncharacterized protein
MPSEGPSTGIRTGANPWRLQATLKGAIAMDLSFPSESVGYLVGELGQVWKTADGGENWSPIMDLGYPYYWYGVHAFSEEKVIISGFDNQNAKGVVRWTDDGGETWSSDVVVNPNGWSFRVRFADDVDGLIMDGANFSGGPNAAHTTTTGGEAAPDWTQVVVGPVGAWFDAQFTLMTNGHARASGITYCSSEDVGASWHCGPSVDSVFDGPVFFLDDDHGWVGGGTISPKVTGWLHLTTDGGTIWSDRVLNAAWPIRNVLFVDPSVGFAAGGDTFSAVGGIYYSANGGQDWGIDVDTGHEMRACSRVGQRLWCAGFNSMPGWNSVVYALDLSDRIFASGFDSP